MTDIEKNVNEEQIAQSEKENKITAPSDRGARERLDAVKKLVSVANKDAEVRASERAKNIKNTELENQKRLAQTKAKIAENTARAERLANERNARIEYSGEYRQRLMARENKKALEEKKRRQEAEIEAARLKEAERARAIEEFVRKEREAAEKRAAASDGLFSPITDPEISEAPQPQEPNTEDSVQEKAEVSETLEKNAASSVTEEASANECGKIMLEIAPDGRLRQNEENNENILHIGGMRYHSMQDIHGFHTPAYHQPSESAFDAELAAANERHTALKLAAVAKAAGVYQDEIRLLEQEEIRYNREISEIQSKRIEYAEHREYMSTVAEMLDPVPNDFYSTADAAAESYDELEDSRITSELLSVEDELSLYEKYREENEQYASPVKNQPEESTVIPEAMEYGYFEPVAAPIAEYPDPYTEYTYPENTYQKPDSATNLYEQSLEAKQLPLDEEDEQMPSEEEIAYHLQDRDRFIKVALVKKLSDYRKSESSLTKKVKKLSAKQNTVTGEEKTLIIVEKIAIRKEITELAVEALTACVYANARFKTITYKRVLVSQVNAYNAVCDEYEMHTGRPLVHLSPDMATDVAEGRISEPIPNVYYHGSEAFGVREGEVSIEEERSLRLAEEASLEEAEFHRLLSENYTREYTRAEIRERDKKQAEKMSAVKRATERDLLLVGLRQEYNLLKLETERDMLLHSFSTDKKKKDKRLSAIERKISRTRSELKRSVKLERGDNSRYYLLSAMDRETEKTKKHANRERLRALRMRLEILLSEREEINERLIALYGGTDKKLTKTKINRKAGAVRKKHAKAAYRKQRGIAARIERIRAPLDMKEKAYALLNKKTSCVATIEESYYKLRRLKPTGRAKKELLSDIRRAKASMRTIDSDVKFLIKKMKRHEQRRDDERRWAKSIVFFFILIILGAILCYFYLDDVIAYFTDLFGKLSGKPPEV